MKNRSRSRRVMMIAILLAAVAAVLALGRAMVLRGEASTPLPTETIARRDIAVTIEATGAVEPVDPVEVKSKASGQILRMPVEAGSIVRAGDLLAQIDTVDVANQYEQALAAQRAAQAKVDVSTAQLRRAEELYAKQVITAVERETASLDFANADAALVKARTDLDTARQRRADATVRAPISGTILEQLVSTGQVISSATSSVSGGTALLHMADLSRIRLRALVSETDIGSVRPGQAATVSIDAFPQHPFEGSVEKIEPQAVVQQSVTMFPVLIAISNEDGLLLPGMNGEVSMTVDQRTNVPAVPLDAVRTLKELPAIAAALGMDPDSASARLARHSGTTSNRRTRSPGPDPAAAGVAGAGGMPSTVPSQAESHGLTKAQVVFVQGEDGLEPRLVRLGISDFDYAQVLSGVEEGEGVVLLSVAESQAKRNQDQSMIRERIGSTMPTGSTNTRAGTGGR